MKVPEDITATVVFTSGAIIFNGIMDIFSIGETIQKMFAAEKTCGLHQMVLGKLAVNLTSSKTNFFASV
jgi:hypothetical protein